MLCLADNRNQENKRNLSNCYFFNCANKVKSHDRRRYKFLTEYKFNADDEPKNRLEGK